MLLEDEGARARNDDKREQLAKSLDIPLTIIRPVNVVGRITRGKMMTFSKEEGRLSGTISIEDVAVCAVRALAQPPKKGGGVFAFEIATSNETVRRIGKTPCDVKSVMKKCNIYILTSFAVTATYNTPTSTLHFYYGFAIVINSCSLQGVRHTGHSGFC